MGEPGGKGKSPVLPWGRVPRSSVDLQDGEKAWGVGGREKERERGGARLTHTYTE